MVGGRRCLPAEWLDTGWRWLARVWDDAVWPAAGAGSYEVENIMSSGQGKFPLEVVTDNNLLRQRYENDELGGANPLMATTSAQGVVISAGDTTMLLKSSIFGEPRFGGIPCALSTCRWPNSVAANGGGGTSITTALCIRASSSIQLVFGNVYNTVNPADSIEIWGGACLLTSTPPRPFTFNGERIKKLSPGQIAITDPIAINVQPGERIGIYVYSAGQVFVSRGTGLCVPAWNEFDNHAAHSAGTDYTGTGVSYTPNTYGPYGPLAVIGDDNGIGLPYVWAFGDSGTAGTGDTDGAYQYGKGWVARTLGAIPHINTSVDGRMAEQSSTNFWKFGGGYTAIIHQLGANDFIAGGRNSATTKTSQIANWRRLNADHPIARIFQPNYDPMTSSTDSWASLDGQTPKSYEPTRLEMNAWLNDRAPLNLSSFTAAAVGAAGANIVRCGAYSNGVFTPPDAGHPLYAILDISTPSTAVNSLGEEVWKVGHCYVTDNLGVHYSAVSAQAIADSLQWIIPHLQAR